MNNLKMKIKNYFSNNFSLKAFFQDCFKHPLYIITHPIKGWDDFKREKTSKRYVAIFYVVMMIIIQTIMYVGSGYLVNKNNPNDFNFILTAILVLFPIGLGTVGNWASTALMDGKGNMGEIFRVIAYSFFPFVWFGLFGTILSNFITVDEIVFYQFFMVLGTGLTVFMMFFGFMGVHEFGLLKNIFMILFTILAIAVILFIILLFLSLIQYIFSFFSSVIEEFIARYL